MHHGCNRVTFEEGHQELSHIGKHTAGLGIQYQLSWKCLKQQLPKEKREAMGEWGCFSREDASSSPGVRAELIQDKVDTHARRTTMIKLFICVTDTANLQKASVSLWSPAPTERDVSEPEEEAEPCDKVMQSHEESILFPYGRIFRRITGRRSLAAGQALKFAVTLFTVGHTLTLTSSQRIHLLVCLKQSFSCSKRTEGLKVWRLAQGMKVPASDLHMPQFFQENPRQFLF